MPPSQWQIQSLHSLPDWFVQVVGQYADGLPARYLAQLLWQRGLREPAELAGFLNVDRYQPTSPFEFGQEMEWAVKRLRQALQNAEKVAIWGDFDADGITATAVLWQGLGQFFAPEQLTYYIPNRLTESHGLSIAGLTQLADWGCTLLVTCDTGSTNLTEITHAQHLGIDVIVTDHHTLPADRPAVTAMINPRYLSTDHPLAHLSGVAVAYKLVEALYETLPNLPQRPLEELLDLVAIGLIADLVQLTGDCRYLAQRGILQLQQNQAACPAPRPGITKLLEFCKRNGDRPTDISFGLGPRINAISRIQGDAHFCVELLTSQDIDRCRILAEETELSNTRRKALQKDVAQQVRARVAQLDLSTNHVIVLADPQWSVGILGLVAGQIAQEYGRPTILLSLEASQELEFTMQRERDDDRSPVLARGSARSVGSIDLYQLVKQQAHLLHKFGGHPLAMGLSLPTENIALFAEAINRQLREQQAGATTAAVLRADLQVTVAELGKDLFRELKWLEPCGIGNPVPKLLIANAWFTQVWNRNIQDHRGQKIRYIKTEFEIWDDTAQTGFPGVWWDHYKDEIPHGRCDAIVELDFNPAKKRYEVRLLAVRSIGQENPTAAVAAIDWILDWRGKEEDDRGQEAGTEMGFVSFSLPYLQITQCPASWDEMQVWFRQVKPGQKLVLAYPPPSASSPIEIWQQLIGIAKYLSRSGQPATLLQLQEKLGVSDRTLQAGLSALQHLGFEIRSTGTVVYVSWQPSLSTGSSDANGGEAIDRFLVLIQEEQFRRRYFYEVPLTTIQAVAYQFFA